MPNMRIKKKKDALLLGRLARAPWRVGVEPYRGGDRSASSNVTLALQLALE